MNFSLRSITRPGTPARLLFGCGIMVHLVFLLSLHFGWLNGLFNDSMHRFGPGADFFSIYSAGMRARHGQPLYCVSGAGEAVPYAYAFRYAPIVAYTLAALLSLLPAVSAFAAWLIVCEWTLLRNIRLTLEHAPDKATGCLAASLWLLFSPYYLELYVGQFTFVSASLVFWAYLAWSPRGATQRKARLEGRVGDGAFTSAVWLKLMPLLFLPVALLRGRWKGVAVGAALLVITSWLYFSGQPADWTAFRMLNADPIPTWHAGNQGLMALAFGLMNERTAPFLAFYRSAVVVVGALLVCMTFRAWQARKGVSTPIVHEAADAPIENTAYESRLLLLYAACSAAYLLLYKDVWEHHYVLLLPPLVLLALRRASVGLWLPSFLIAALPTLFAFYDVRGLGFNEDPEGYWRPAVSLLQHGWKPLSALWLLAGVVDESIPLLNPSGSIRRSVPVWRRRLTGAIPALGCIACCLIGARWAAGAIGQQKHSIRESVWAPPIFQMQRHANTCGPAALAAVCCHYGIPTDEDEIARRAGTTSAGTSMLGLQTAAEEKGLSVMGRQVSMAELRSMPLPCILFFHPGHFAVLSGIDGDRFLLADPSRGQQAWTARQLAHSWRGELLVIGPAEQLPGRRLGVVTQR